MQYLYAIMLIGYARVSTGEQTADAARLFGVHPATVSRLLPADLDRVFYRTFGSIAPQAPMTCGS